MSASREAIEDSRNDRQDIANYDKRQALLNLAVLGYKIPGSAKTAESIITACYA